MTCAPVAACKEFGLTLCSKSILWRCREAWVNQEGAEEMEAMDIDKEQDHGEGGNDAPEEDESAQVMPTEEQAAFHRQPSR